MRDHNDDSYTIHIDSFNNKGQKGDDDFETWLETEAPLVSNSTITAIDNSYTVDLSNHATCTSTILSSNVNTITITGLNHHASSKQKKLPVDILYKWYPSQMKEQNDD